MCVCALCGSLLLDYVSGRFSLSRVLASVELVLMCTPASLIKTCKIAKKKKKSTSKVSKNAPDCLFHTSMLSRLTENWKHNDLYGQIGELPHFKLINN